MMSVRAQQIDRVMFVIAIVIFAVILGFAARALRDQIVANYQATSADGGGDKAR